MEDKYSTIQQHQPLRVPVRWDKQEKAFVVQLEEILDDIYRRFGRLRLEDMSKAFRKRIEDDEGNIAELVVDVGQIVIDVGNKYDKVSGIAIDANGVGITGSKYVKINSGCELDIESGGDLNVKSGGALNINSGGQIDINATGNLKLTGSNVQIKSGSTFEVESDNFSLNSLGRKLITGAWELSSYGFMNLHPVQCQGKDVKFKIADTSSGVADYFYTELTFNNNTPNNNNPYFMPRVYFSSCNPITGNLIKFPICLNPDNGYITVGEDGLYGSNNGYETYFNAQKLTPNTTSSNSYIGGALKRYTYSYLSTVDYVTLIQSSSREIKHDIKPLESKAEQLDKLKPVTFVYDSDPDERTRMGLIYEDTVEVMPEICTNDESNKAINYVELIPMLLKEIQDLRARVAALEGGN